MERKGAEERRKRRDGKLTRNLKDGGAKCDKERRGTCEKG